MPDPQSSDRSEETIHVPQHVGLTNASDATAAFLDSNTDSAANVSTKSLVGKKFGDYYIEEELARGGMGVVYKARQGSLGRIVALKMILSGKLAGADDVRRFTMEAEAAARLEHPNIVPIYEIGEIEGQHFFSMGFVEGGSLDRLLRENPLSPKVAAQLMIQVAEAIEFAHGKQVVHRDLKPANILLTRRGSSSSEISQGSLELSQARRNSNVERSLLSNTELEWIPKVSDFGLAKQMGSGSDLTGTGQILGTPSYMPPEQAGGNSKDIGTAADVYALGAILYRTLTGRPPFQAATAMETVLQVLKQEPVPVRQLNPAVPSDLETICLKCLQKDPAKRYASADALADDLRRWLQGDPIMARPISRWEKSIRWFKKNPAIASAVAVGFLSLGVIVAILYSANNRLIIQRDFAIDARNEANKQSRMAESRLRRAIEVVNLMTARAASVEWAQKPELQEERQEILKDAIYFYQGLIADASDSLEVRREASKAYALLAGTHFVLNDLAAAQKAAQDCIDLCAELERSDPQNLEYTARIAQMTSMVGTIHSLNGDNDKAWQDVTRGSELIRKIADKAPDEISYQIQALEAMSYLAYAAIPGGTKYAESVVELMQAIDKTILRLKTGFEPTYKSQVAIAFANNVKAAYKNSEQKSSEAMELYREAIAMLKTIKDQDAPDARSADQFLQTWAICHLNYGINGTGTGDTISEENLRDIEEGLHYSRVLLQCHPKAYVFRMQLMQALRVQAAALARIGKAEESNLAMKESVQILEELMRDNPKQPWVLAMRAMQESVQLVERIRKGELQDFEKELIRLEELSSPTNRRDILYNSVCAYSQAIPHSPENKSLYLECIRKRLEEMRVLGALSDPRQQGHMKVDTDLDPIRSEIDWEQYFGATPGVKE
jgi:serine/threonine protein kinase